MKAAWLPVARATGLFFTLGLVPACLGPTTVHAPNVAPDQLDAQQARKHARKLVRRTRPARNVAVQATLWDASLLTAETASGEISRDELLRWHRRDIIDATTFTVVVELEQRLGDADLMDPVLDPKRWSFALERDGRSLAPQSVEVQAIDRYPMESPGYHWRLAFAVRFPGNLHRTALGAGPTTIVLQVRPPAIEAPRRDRLGKFLTEHGASLSWRIEPAT